MNTNQTAFSNLNARNRKLLSTIETLMNKQKLLTSLATVTAFVCIAAFSAHTSFAQSTPKDPSGAIDVPRLPQPGANQGSAVKQGSDAKQGSATKQGSAAKQGSDSKQGSGNSQGSTGKTSPGNAALSGDGRFEKLIQERTTNNQKIDRLYATIPVGFAREQKKYLAAIAALKQRNIVILEEMKEAAVESYLAAPGENQKVINYLLQMTSRHLTGKDPQQFAFNPDRALELFNLVTSKPLDIAGKQSYGFRANYLTENYREAKKFLEAAKAENENVAVSSFDDLERAQKDMKRELEFRQADGELPRVAIQTDKGKIVLELFENHAPNTVANFISLVEKGFYNGLDFHKVTSNLTVAAGCPYNNGTGGPGYEVKCECYQPEIMRQHFRGVISMAHGGRDTGGSRFFITKQRIPSYDGQFTVFGRVIEGMQTVYGLNVVDNTAVLQKNARPATKMTSVSVLRKGNRDYTPEKISNKKLDAGTSDLLSAPLDPLGSDK